MKRPLRPLLCLFVAVLLMQTLVAPAHCFLRMAASAGWDVLICSPEGMRSVHIGSDGQEIPSHPMAPGFCAACHALPEAILPEAPAVPAPAWFASAVDYRPAADHRLLPPARAPPYAPTGPPQLS
ncbi:hypothetical protein ACVFYP_16315 [Roseomonas sp. F4]